jgi:L-cysteine desulfidase
MEQNMFIRILNSEMELATGCTEPGAVALTAAEAGQALRKAGVDKAEEITVNASINIIKNAMSAGIPGTDYEGMDYAAAIGALGGDPVYLLEVMNHVPRETVEAAAALVKAGKVRVNVAQVPRAAAIRAVPSSATCTPTSCWWSRTVWPPSTSGTRTLPPQATAMWSPRSRSRPS